MPVGFEDAPAQPCLRVCKEEDPYICIRADNRSHIPTFSNHSSAVCASLIHLFPLRDSHPLPHRNIAGNHRDSCRNFHRAQSIRNVPPANEELWVRHCTDRFKVQMVCFTQHGRRVVQIHTRSHALPGQSPVHGPRFQECEAELGGNTFGNGGFS